MPWYVLITKPKHELKVAARLQDLGLEICCPTRVEIRQWSDRKKKVTVPLLPSMLLINIDQKDRANVFAVPGAVRYLFWLGEPAVVPEKEVEVLREIANKKHEVLATEKIKIGQEVDLKEFGLSTEKGTVKYISGNQCWVVLPKLGYVIKLKIK